MEQPSPKVIKWGLIGLGNIAHKFAEDLGVVGDAVLHAVASRSQEKSDTFAEKFNAKKAYNSYEALAKDPEIDAVYIATPHCFHKEHAILCLQHQKAVLCEKPFAMNLQEVTAMIAVAKKNNVLLMEALWTYFLPSYQYVLMVVENNSFGKLLSLEADFGFHTPFAPENRLFKKELGGGSLLDIGIYPVFAALSTLGVPEHIKAKATFFENGADSSCDMIFKYKNAIAVLRSTLLEETKTTAVFTFEKGSISLHSRFHEDTKVTAILEGKAETYKAAFTGIGYCFEIAHFNQLLREDKKESEIMSFEFSKNLLTILDNIREIIGLKY